MIKDTTINKTITGSICILIILLHTIQQIAMEIIETTTMMNTNEGQ